MTNKFFNEPEQDNPDALVKSGDFTIRDFREMLSSPELDQYEDDTITGFVYPLPDNQQIVLPVELMQVSVVRVGDNTHLGFAWVPPKDISATLDNMIGDQFL